MIILTTGEWTFTSVIEVTAGCFSPDLSRQFSTMVPKGGKKAAPAQMRKMLPMSILEDQVRRWDADEVARKRAFPSISFAEPSDRETALEGGADGSRGATFVPRCKEKNDMQITELEVNTSSNFPQNISVR
jgi:hypothetical protein